MFVQALATVFANAAIPQKLVILGLLSAIPLTLVAALLGSGSGRNCAAWRRVVAELRFAGPALGLLVGALNSFHMGQTIQRLHFDVTAKQLAPGILEVSTVIGLGALIGILAAVLHVALGFGRHEAT